MPSRRGDGTLVFKICFYGPSLGGKTTALEWVYNREGLASGDMQQIQDPTGRTLFFDRVVARVGIDRQRISLCGVDVYIVTPSGGMHVVGAR